ncbi:MAG: copper chaperone PCu(A)C [Gammaproteobacteria bacterium]|nr:copper chaperone PCu(A)C [Gammaproteobacteria bacterium]
MSWWRVLLLAGVLPSAALACPGLEVKGAWVREPPPASPGTAAFMSLHNAGASALTITGWRSPQFGTTMLHATLSSGGQTKMRGHAQLSMAPGEGIVLAPGGLHVMLMKPTGTLHEGEPVSLELSCGPQTTSFEMPVRREAPAAP